MQKTTPIFLFLDYMKPQSQKDSCISVKGGND